MVPYDCLLLLFELLLGLAPVRLLVLLQQALRLRDLCGLQDETYVSSRAVDPDLDLNNWFASGFVFDFEII